MTDIITN